MVKKTSFFEKLRSHFRTSNVRVQQPDGDRTVPKAKAKAGGRQAAAQSASRVGTATATVEPVAPRRETEPVSRRKMSRQEEATLAVNEGFRELTSLLRGMQTRVDDQGERFVQAAEGLARLPELGESQLDIMRIVADRLEQQNQASEMMVQSLGKLPETLDAVREALDRAAATDERAASTLEEFKGHMARIETSMERMVDHSREHSEASKQLAARDTDKVEELAESLSKGQEEIADRLESTQRESVRSLREAHADQAGRLGKMIQEGTKTNRAVLILLVMVFVALVAIAGLLATT